jgi:hypothetical protein
MPAIRWKWIRSNNRVYGWNSLEPGTGNRPRLYFGVKTLGRARREFARYDGRDEREKDGAAASVCCARQ